MQQLIDLIQQEMTTRANPDYAPKMKAYMKDHFEFLGVNMPARKTALKAVFQQIDKPKKDSLFSLMNKLWALPEREYQYIAMDIAKGLEKKITKADIDDIITLITTKSWWDSVDFLASTLLGAALKKQGEFVYEFTDKLIQSDNMWLRRSAIIFQLKYQEDVDFELLKSHILYTIDEKEFFIRKAQGWALRQYSKYNPAAIAEFIETYQNQLSNLTIKEGSKYIKN